jgi:RAB protein geranylgeranyltransferase component A
MTGKEEEFFQENAQLLVELRRDKELSKALLKYFQLSQEQKKHIVDSINLLGKED